MSILIGSKTSPHAISLNSFWSRASVHRVLAALTIGVWLFIGFTNHAQVRQTQTVPVILDTDIGNDIDDTWALGFLLKCPELDLKLAIGDRGRAIYRARLLAKFLECVDRTNVPVGVGLDIKPRNEGRLSEWVKGYDLKNYPGKICDDGVGALIDIVMKSEHPVTLICIGPVPNISEALRREPRIASHARFVGMHGSLHRGYGGADVPVPETNVKVDPASCRAAFSAPWDITITPLDTCGFVTLTGDKYRRVCDSKDPVASAIVANYRIWVASSPTPDSKVADVQSSVLFDTVAVYLSFRQDYCVMEKMGIRVTDTGFTVEDPKAKKLNVAIKWRDLDGFENLLVQRLTGEQ